MADFPIDSEVRNHLWIALSQRAGDIHIPEFRYHELVSQVVAIAKQKGFTSQHLGSNLIPRLPQFVMELVLQGILQPKGEFGQISWLDFRVTDFGKSSLATTSISCYDPDGYMAEVKRQVGSADAVIIQYVGESIACFRRSIHFASAVMLGAAAEKAVYLLFDSIIGSRQDVNEQERMRKIYLNPNMPKIFELIQRTLDPLVAKNGLIPYEVHQGCAQQLPALFDIIRVQRNECVHPTTPASGEVSVIQLTLCLNNFPHALGVLYRLINWFKQNVDTL